MSLAIKPRPGADQYTLCIGQRVYWLHATNTLSYCLQQLLLPCPRQLSANFPLEHCALCASANETKMCDCPSTPPPDLTAGNALCPNRPPPRVAHCVVGAARTFATDQAALSLRHHLIEDFGGRGLTSSAPDVFFHMKLVDDVPKSQKEWAFKQLDMRGGDVCRQACRFAPRAVTLLNASHSGPAAPGRCLRSGFFAKPENRARAVSQWHGFAACLGMVEAHEAAARATCATCPKPARRQQPHCTAHTRRAHNTRRCVCACAGTTSWCSRVPTSYTTAAWGRTARTT